MTIICGKEADEDRVALDATVVARIDIIAAEIVEHLQAALAQIEIRSLPALAHRFRRRFTFYVAPPIRSIVSRSLPLSSTATFAALPAMSLTPFVPLVP